MKHLATTLAKKRTSLDLPPDLLERTDEAVRLGVARSRNTLIEVAIENYLNTLDRIASIDARFAEMGEDARYQEMHRELAAGFAESDAEAFARGVVGHDKATFVPSAADSESGALTLEEAGP